MKTRAAATGGRMTATNHLTGKTILAKGFHMPRREAVDVLADVLITVGEDGRIRVAPAAE